MKKGNLVIAVFLLLASCAQPYNNQNNFVTVSLYNQNFQSAYNSGFNLWYMQGNARSDFQREVVRRYISGIYDRISKLNLDRSHMNRSNRNSYNYNGLLNSSNNQYGQILKGLTSNYNTYQQQQIDNQLYRANKLLIHAKTLAQ